VLVHLRGEVVRQRQDAGGPKAALDPENVAMRTLGQVFASRWSYETAQRLARVGQGPLVRKGFIEWLPGMLGGWTAMRDMPAVPAESFREWWKQREGGGSDGRT
jgi:L-lactate dehydrogenase complex protein LldF